MLVTLEEDSKMLPIDYSKTYEYFNNQIKFQSVELITKYFLMAEFQRY